MQLAKSIEQSAWKWIEDTKRCNIVVKKDRPKKVSQRRVDETKSFRFHLSNRAV